MSYKKWLSLFALFSVIITALPCCSDRNTTSISGQGNLEIRVEDTSHNPLWGAKVVSSYQPDGQLKVTGITGTDGTVKFKDIMSGEYKFNISRFDYFPVEVTLTFIAGQTRDITIRLTPENPQTTTITTSAARITFANLTAQPGNYNNTYIVIEGYWFDGFEIAVLAERLEPASFPVGNLKPAGTLIWVKNGLSEDVRTQLILQPDNPTGYPAHYGKVELTGLLEYGGKYGHLDSYTYQLAVYESKLLPWTP